MKAMKNTTKALFALAFSLMLLAGGFTTVWAQQTEPEPTAQEKDGMAMMKDCPMMKEMMSQMMEDCPMMKEMMKGGMMQGKNATPETSGEEAAATLTADSVQVVQITVGPEGFEPTKLTLVAGVPARLVFTRTTDATCAKQVQIPAFEIEKTDLPLNEPVAIEFTPTEAGTFTFACGMDMLKGAIVVKS